MHRTILAFAGSLLLALAFALPVAASEAEMCVSGADFGAMHAEHARDGMLGAAMHPGMHAGFSICIP